MKTSRMVLAGGSGFLGGVLAAYFANRGWEVVVLTRTPGPGPAPLPGPVRQTQWDGATRGPWCRELEGARAVINLAGVSVNCRYHARNRRRLVSSRVWPTRILGEAIALCDQPPQVWLNASTATVYKHTYGPPWDEAGQTGSDPAAKDAFSIEIADAWEREFAKANVPRTRQVVLRSAMVLGLGDNSVVPTLCRLARFGLGGSMAGGRQFVSWIHEEDFCRAIEWLMDHTELSGVFNLAAPNPVTNADMMALFRKLCGRPFGLPATASMLEMGAFFLQTETELVIKSRRVISRRLPESGFQFRYSTMQAALTALITGGPGLSHGKFA